MSEAEWIPQSENSGYQGAGVRLSYIFPDRIRVVFLIKRNRSLE